MNTAEWHRIVTQRDVQGLAQILDHHAVFYSPILHTPQKGKNVVLAYLRAALKVLGTDQFRYLREASGDHLSVLEFETQIDDIMINGVDIIHWTDAGKIDEFRVMIRPLKAIEAVHAAMKAELTRGS